MSNELAVRNDEIFHSIEDLLRLGDTLVKSGLLPKSVNSPQSAVAIILMGRELGIGTMTSLTMIQVISGKPTVPPQLMLALARRTKELEDIKIEDDGNKCTVTIKRKGQSAISTSFSMENAKAMGLAGKDNWTKQPQTMRQWRALAANLRLTFTDAIANLYTPEEMGATVDPDTGKAIEVIEPDKWTNPPEEPRDIPGLGAMQKSGEVVELPTTPAEREARGVIELFKLEAENYDKRVSDEQLKKMRWLAHKWLLAMAVHPAEVTDTNRGVAGEMVSNFLQEVFGVSDIENLDAKPIGAILKLLSLKSEKQDGKNVYTASGETELMAKYMDYILDWHTEKTGQTKMEL